MTEDGRASEGTPRDDRRGQEPDADPRHAAGRPGMVPPDSGPRSPYGAPLRTESPAQSRPGFTPHQYDRRPGTSPQYDRRPGTSPQYDRRPGTSPRYDRPSGTSPQYD